MNDNLIETIPGFIKKKIKPTRVLIYPDKGCNLCHNGIHRRVRHGSTTRLTICPRALLEIEQDEKDGKEGS